MKSVIENNYIYIIKNSKFISLIYYIDSEEEVKKHLENAKKEYPDATHYCYGYILDNIRKESDDGEPSGTAGIPILQVLEKNELNHTLCIVIRYFGKIKLGAGGLVRAYTKSVTSCLKDHIITLKKGYLINISFPYSITKKIDYLLANSKILKKDFDNTITYQVLVDQDILKTLKNWEEDINITIIKDSYI